MYNVANFLGATTAITVGAILTDSPQHAAEWLHLIDRYGAMAVILAYMLVKDWLTWRANSKRYGVLEKRLDARDEFIHHKLMKALQEAAATQTASNTLMQAIKTKMDLTQQEAKDVHTPATICSTAPVWEAGACADTANSQRQPEYRRPNN